MPLPDSLDLKLAHDFDDAQCFGYYLPIFYDYKEYDYKEGDYKEGE